MNILFDEYFNRGFKYEEFELDFSVDLDRFSIGFQPGWSCGALGDISIPFDWDESYKNIWKQSFEPSRFYKNVVTICASYDSANVEQRDMYSALLDQLIGAALRYSIVKDNCRFSVYEFDFPRHGYVLKSGWVSGIGNGFVIRGLLRIFSSTGDDSVMALAEEYLRAYFVVNGKERQLESPWFSWVDDEGYLWFDEYPGDDGVPSLVLNGHIHSLYALYYYLKLSTNSSLSGKVSKFLFGAITTIKYNALKFRRFEKINRYSLREKNRNDYLPDRTVRQQRELFKISGDREFLRFSRLFEKDINAFNAASSLPND